MLKDAPVTTILPVTNLERASAFYEKQLGLESRGRAPDGKQLFCCGGGTTLALLETVSSARSANTAISFEVDDIVTQISSLKGQGVIFEDYDLPGLQTVDQVCVLGAEKAAWFKDPDGNMLCIHEVIA